MLIVGWWSSSPRILAKETIDSVPIELRFYSRFVVVTTLLVPTRPENPLSPHSVAVQSRLRSTLLISLHKKRPDLPPPGPACLCYPLPLPPLRLRSVLGVTTQSIAVNLHQLPVSNRLQPMPRWPPPTLPARMPQRLDSCSPTVPLLLLKSHRGVLS